MITAVSVFFVSLVYIFIKAFQQLNVVHDAYKWVVPCSLMMAASEVFVISMVATNKEWWLFLPMGLGAGCGAMISMFLHKRLVK